MTAQRNLQRLSRSTVTPKQSGDHLCPSAFCDEGAILLGIVEADGSVAYLTPRLVIDREFVERAHQGRMPEKRFRFSQPCLEGRCDNWTGADCAVVDRALKVADQIVPLEALSSPLPKCGIRAECRWFSQAGPNVCRICRYIVTGKCPQDGAEIDDNAAA